MNGRKIAVTALTGAFVLMPATAMAAVYPAPQAATLEGSVLSPVCDADAPYLNYSIVVNDPAGMVDPSITTATITFLNPSGSNWSTTVPLGTGRILWPGASVDASGAANGWPGWAYDSTAGEVVSVGTGNFGWTRTPGTQVMVEVNPEMTFAVTYPESTPACMTDPSVEVASSGGTPALSNTGGTVTAVPTLSTTGFDSVPMALAAGGLLVAGAASVIVAARRTSTKVDA